MMLATGSWVFFWPALVGSLLFLAHAVVAVGDKTAFVLGGSAPITVSRMDPIVNSGEVGGHVHAIIGASNFRNKLNSPDDMQKASCSSLKVTADKSNYWTPIVYWINGNGTFSPMISHTRIYYIGRDAESGNKVNAFPPGLRMISGLANKRDPGSLRAFGAAVSLGRTVPMGTNGRYFPNTTNTPSTASADLTMSINFPNCGWANQSLDSWDHFSHMTWPVQGNDHKPALNGPDCPNTHPIRYPRILIESVYHIEPKMKEEWSAGRDGPLFTLSNGDTTGLTFHGDFVAGWIPDVLQNAMETCGVGDDVWKCGAFDGHLARLPDMGDKDEGWTFGKCRYEGNIPAEDIGLFHPLSKLPGCNPLWGFSDSADKPTDCGEVAQPGFVAPNLQYNGQLNWRVPAVLPDVGTSNLTTLIPTTGQWDPHVRTFFSQWASDSSNTSDLITGILSGTQELIDAAAKGGTILSSLFSGEVADYDATSPTSTVDLAAAGGNTAVPAWNGTYLCPNDDSSAWNPPCEPPAETGGGAVSTSQTVLASPSDSASSSASTSDNAIPEPSVNGVADINKLAALDIAPSETGSAPQKDSETIAATGTPVSSTTAAVGTAASSKGSHRGQCTRRRLRRRSRCRAGTHRYHQ